MKKKEVTRAFKFSDALLITKGKEKIAFMRRDASEFEKYGIIAANITQLENQINSFTDFVTDIEALSDQTAITTLKDAKAEALRVSIRDLMTRVGLKFKMESTQYRKFGTELLARQTDAELLLTGRRVVRVGNLMITQLTEKGVTAAMLTNISSLSLEFENLIIDMKIKIGERDVMQEERVEKGNAIYATLVSYTNTGQSIWTTRNVAKYNDYVLYNTVSGDAPIAPII